MKLEIQCQNCRIKNTIKFKLWGDDNGKHIESMLIYFSCKNCKVLGVVEITFKNDGSFKSNLKKYDSNYIG